MKSDIRYSSGHQRARCIKRWGDQVIRFWSKVDKSNPDGCWLWTGSKVPFGYGTTYYNGKPQRTHRISYKIAHGEIPDDVCVLHKCDNPACVNPDHLFLGTKHDNTQDMVKKGRQKYVTHNGSENGNSKLKESDVTQIRCLFESGYSQKGIAKLFSISTRTVCQIVENETWKHV